MYALVEDVRARLAQVSEDIYVCGYGHFGDGNLHLNVADGRRSRDNVCSPPPLASSSLLSTSVILTNLCEVIEVILSRCM
jgi:hypothetical protein